MAFYLPGYRSGGPVRTIANFVDHLGDEFDIRIVTRDRDALEAQPYSDVKIDRWNKVGKAQVFYASPKMLTLRRVANLISDTPHDVLYLNSFFTPKFTLLPLIARKSGLLPKRPCVIAPRGEFSEGALALKALKKQIYVRLAKSAGLYGGLLWQASSSFEAKDIARTMGVSERRIAVAPNLPALLDVSAVHDHVARTGPLRLVFLSRISPMKNLDFLLQLLQEIDFEVGLDIYGTVSDGEYWDLCNRLISRLPSKVCVRYKGAIPHCEVGWVLAIYDLFVLPTLGENYGHVIAESLTQGTPVLISDQTPWQNLEKDAAGWELPLEDRHRFVEVIRKVNSMDSSEYLLLRKSAADYAIKKLSNHSIIDSNRRLFEEACQGRS